MRRRRIRAWWRARLRVAGGWLLRAGGGDVAVPEASGWRLHDRPIVITEQARGGTVGRLTIYWAYKILPDRIEIVTGRPPVVKFEGES